MKRIFMLFVAIVVLIGCSKDTKQLTQDDLSNLSTEEKIEKITDNVLSDYDHHFLLIENSLAVYYVPKFVYDSKLITSDKKESFPNVAMTLAEQLSLIELDEVAIVAYEPMDAGSAIGMTRVSVLFDKESLNEETFQEWHEYEKPNRFYRLATAYNVRGVTWEKLSEEEQSVVRRQYKEGDSDFWSYYGHNVE